MDQKYENTLMQFTLAAKAIIYDAGRMEQLIKIMGTAGGAINAVNSVLSAIGQKKKIPSVVAPLLGVTILMLLVDSAQQIIGKKPSPKMLNEVITTLMESVNRDHPPEPAEEQQPAAPRGLMQGA